MRRAVAVWGPVVAWCALIFYLSSRQNLDLQHLAPAWGAWDHLLRKLAHAAEYSVLFGLARRGWPDRRAFLFCVAYAISDECHQAFVPTRGAQVSDVALDSAAAAAAWWAVHVSPVLRRN